MVKSSELQTHSDALANQKFNYIKQSAHAAGSLPKARTFSKQLSKPESPTEHEYSLCQLSPSSEISFCWEEVPAHPRTASSCSSSENEGVHSSSSFASASTNSNEKISVTTEDRHFNESLEGKEERSFGVTVTNKVDLKKKGKSTHLALKSVVSENLENRNFRMNKTCDSTEDVSEVHSEEFSYPQKLAEDNCRKKKTLDVPMREDSGSDSSDDSVEVTQANGTKAISSLNLSVMHLLDRSNIRHLLIYQSQ